MVWLDNYPLMMLLLKGFILKYNRATLLVIVCFWPFISFAAEEFSWPYNAIAAVSLSYDDALNSQLDNAIPALNKYGFKGSFYLSLASPAFKSRQQEWQSIANKGHELGNHTINHACRGVIT